MVNGFKILQWLSAVSLSEEEDCCILNKAERMLSVVCIRVSSE